MEVVGVIQLLDQGLPQTTASRLTQRGLRAVHVSELEMSLGSFRVFRGLLRRRRFWRERALSDADWDDGELEWFDDGK